MDRESLGTVDQNLKESLLSGVAGAGWEKIGARGHHGVALPISSLRSQQGHGIGEYFDLLPVIDWCRSVGMDLIQLLPIQDSGLDPSPYNPLSAFALNPWLLSLRKLPWVEEDATLMALLNTPLECDKDSHIDHDQVRQFKSGFLSQYIKTFEPRWREDAKIGNYRAQNPWLAAYAAFMSLKEKHGWSSWETWPEEVRYPEDTTLEMVRQSESFRYFYYEVLQYLCHQQMLQVQEYARRSQVLLMGDLPILISKDSADVWWHRHLFRLDFVAGAPPDMYSEEGQKWGFPLYRWEALEAQGYLWWKNRVQLASQYYDLYRLDHVVGFYRIWAIPPEKTGKEGFFIPEEEKKWIGHGEKILRVLLLAASLLPIGEDLGMIPEGVRENLSHLGIAGMKVMRWERAWHEEGQPFIDPKAYPKLSLTTVSTHDAEPLRLWWEAFPEEAKIFCQSQGWVHEPMLSQERLIWILRMSHQSGSLLHINLLLEYFSCVSELSWTLPAQDRINVPGKMLRANWSYRFREEVEVWTKHVGLQEIIRSCIGAL